MKNLFFIHTVDIFGDEIIELRVSDKPFNELTEDDDYNTFLGALDSEDGKEMEAKGIDCSIEENCLQYAKEKGVLIPDTYNLICIS